MKSKNNLMKNNKFGTDLLNDPILNKGTAFSKEEREKLGLNGLLPPKIFTIREQHERVLKSFFSKKTNIEKYIYMMGLHDRNETLFYYTVIQNLKTMLPIIYTPVVGEACKKFGSIWRRPRGLFLTINHKNKIKKVLKNWKYKDIDVIVVTDGERILGLGDLGCNGMGIPIGKLSLYTACAGINPEKTLPILIDVGTNNRYHLKNPYYFGLRHERVRDEVYDNLLDEFVDTVSDVFPKAVLQFEDFANQNASRLLKKYRHNYRVMNDDIQGTAAVTLAGILASQKISKRILKREKILFVGAGSAGIGVGNLISYALEKEGVNPNKARERCWFFDDKGLLIKDRNDLYEDQIPFSHEQQHITDLVKVIETIKPTILIGLSGVGGLFTEPILKKMSEINIFPTIFALSNPTSNAECTAEQAYKATNGNCIFASGSPFPKVKIGEKLFDPGQCNNVYIFPGVGLGAIESEAKTLSDDMFLIAAKTIPEYLTKEEINNGRVFPSLDKIREISIEIAKNIAVSEDNNYKNWEPEKISKELNSKMFSAKY